MDPIAHSETNKPLALLGIILSVIVLYVASSIINALYYDPLHNIPGPKINAITRLPYIRHMLGGTTKENVTLLHDKYGDVVRVSPNEVSFISGETAWQDIYGFRTGQHKGQQNMLKDPVWYPKSANGAPSLLQSDDEAHSRGRRILSHAFSEKALAEQEPLLQRFVDMLIQELRQSAASTEDPQDIADWYNWTAFDIISDLLLGEPFGCLQARATHKYVGLIFTMLESFPILYTITWYPWVKYVGVILGFIDISILRRRRDFALWIYEKAASRAERETSRPDFYSHILANNGTKQKDGKVMSISQDEINSNCLLFIAAGSETTATLLSGATYLLLKNPSAHAILKDEIRSAFDSYGSITIDSISSLPYLLAVLSESLRYFPPVATGFPRQTPPTGATISGHYIPTKTSVYVSSYPAGHSNRNFRDPEVFAPERWMGDAKYADDKRNALQPFSFGPRNCLGKNLAHAEMRLILAKMIWSFDLELDPRSENWMDECKIFTLWKKPELAVRIKEVVRD